MIRRILILGFGVVVTLALLELGLRALPVFTVPEPGLLSSEDTVQIWRGKNPSVTYSRGMYLERPHTHTPNPIGIVNGGIPDPDSAVWIHGDSYIEALMLEYPQTLQGMLEMHLSPDNLAVASFNISGATLLDYLNGIKAAERITRKAAHILVLSPDDISESFVLKRPAKALNVFVVSDSGITPSYNRMDTWTKSPAWKRKIFANSSLVRYIKFNVKFLTKNLLQDGIGADRPRVGAPSTAIPQYVISGLTAYLDSVGKASSRVAFLLDCDRDQIVDDLLMKRFDAQQSHYKSGFSKTFETLAKAKGMKVENLCDDFERQIKRTGRAVDYRMADKHWNEDGHAVAAEAAFRLLRQADWFQIESPSSLE